MRRADEKVGCAWLVLGLLVLAQPAQADWLALWPSCAMPEPTSPRFASLYPAPGFPAVVEAGAVLEARVRVTVPLTPPPGRQQPAVLAPWSAALTARVPGLFGIPEGAVTYPLPVVDLRPEGQADLVYRLRLPVPAWTAPGAYDFVLRGPAGELRTVSGVLVLDPASDVDLDAAKLSSLLAQARVAPPRAAEVGFALLRIGRRMYRIGERAGCAGEVAGRVRALSGELGPLHWPVGGLSAAARALAADAALARDASAVAIRFPPGPGPDLRARVPVTAAGYDVRGAAGDFHPIGEWHGRMPEHLVLRIAGRPGANVRVLARGGAPPLPAPASLSLAARLGFAVPIAPALRPEQRLALRLDAEHTSFSAGPGRLMVDSAARAYFAGLAVDRRGRAELRPIRVHAAAQRGGGGCRLHPTPGARSLGWGWLLSLFVVCRPRWRPKRREDRVAGNRLGPPGRFLARSRSA